MSATAGLARLIRAWYDEAARLLPPGAEVWDGHAHSGADDPDGFVGVAETLVTNLVAAGHRGSVLASNANPAGYRDANDRVLAEAEQAGGRLVPFLRVDPNDPEALKEVERSFQRGHRGVKLHPRAERFGLDHPAVAQIAAAAAQRGAPVLVHAGRGIPSLGRQAVALAGEVHGLNLILAHCAISDLAWLGPVARDHPGVYFDTAWWNPADLRALVAWVPGSRIVYASDSPYGNPLTSFTLAMRTVAATGHPPAGRRAIFGETLLALLDGRRPPDDDPHPQPPEPVDASLLRVFSDLHGALVRVFGRHDPAQQLALARRACEVAPGAPHEETLRAIAATIDAAAVIGIDGDHDAWRTMLGALLCASVATLTAAVPVPDLS